MTKNLSSILRHRIILQRRVLTESPSGDTVDTWEDAGTLRASVEPLKGQEFFRGTEMPQRVAQVDVRIRVRYRQGFDPAKHRVVHGGIIYQLVAVIPDRNRAQTQLMVRSIATQQPDGSKVNA